MFLILFISAAFGINIGILKQSDFGHKQGVDGSLRTAWAEDVGGSGKDEWFELKLAKTTQVKTLSVWPGNLGRGTKSFNQYSRPRTIKVELDGKIINEAFRFQDIAQRVDIPINSTGKTIRITIIDAYEGVVHSDLCIAELAVNFKDGGAAAKISKWQSTKAGKRAEQKHSSKMDAVQQT